jgi:hypothetical protein
MIQEYKMSEEKGRENIFTSPTSFCQIVGWDNHEPRVAIRCQNCPDGPKGVIRLIAGFDNYNILATLLTKYIYIYTSFRILIEKNVILPPPNLLPAPSPPLHHVLHPPKTHRRRIPQTLLHPRPNIHLHQILHPTRNTCVLATLPRRYIHHPRFFGVERSEGTA